MQVWSCCRLSEFEQAEELKAPPNDLRSLASWPSWVDWDEESRGSSVSRSWRSQGAIESAMSVRERVVEWMKATIGVRGQESEAVHTY